MQDNQGFESVAEGQDQTGVVEYWMREIKTSMQRERQWRKQAHDTWDVYLQRKHVPFNILWSNTQTIKPAVFNSIPKPDVRRRFSDKDPVSKQVSETLERALSYSMDNDQYDFVDTINRAILDYLICGRGTAQVGYSSKKQQVIIQQQQPDGTVVEVEQTDITDEYAYCSHGQWNKVYYHQASSWDKTRWIAVEAFVTKPEAQKMFGDLPANTQLVGAADADNAGCIGYDQEELVKLASDTPDLLKRLQVFKIWDKDSRKVLYISPGVPEKVLKEQEDPFGLPGFFPFPRPLLMTASTTDMIPVPEYEMYREQAQELNKITSRINALIEGVKVRGLYASTIKEVEALANLSDFQFAPVANVQGLLDGNIDRMIWTMPIEIIAAVIMQLKQHQEKVKQTIFEIVGISDILRGASQASETATAQNIKAQFGSLRIDERKKEIARFIRDLLRIKAHIIAKFEPETLEEMTGLPVPPEVIAILQNEQMRSYRIDIETDSTVAGTQNDEQQAMSEMLRSIVEYMNGVSQLVASGALPLEAAKEMLQAAVRRMKMGRTVEDAIDMIGQQPAMPQQPDMMPAPEPIPQGMPMV